MKTCALALSTVTLKTICVRTRKENFPRRHALCRRRQMPAPGRRDDVPELHGHARGRALDPRARAPPLRDAAGRNDPRRLEERGGPPRARSLPRLQGVQVGMSRQCGHGDLQGGVPVALLRGRLRFGALTRWGSSSAGRGSPPRRRRLANFFTQTPACLRGQGPGWIAGARRIPVSRRGHSASPSPGGKARRITAREAALLWPDTFNDHFHPETALAAVEALEAAGFDVAVRGTPVLRPPALRLWLSRPAVGMLRQIL
jgi:hypothetical protein